jgi:hypothetical protein
MIEVYEEWSDRKRSRQASVSAPDVSSMRRGINALSEPFDRKRSSTSQVHDPRAHSSTVPPGKRSNDKEEVNLDDPYPYDEPSSSQYSSRKTTITKSSPLVSKSILKVPVAPPTPDFQPPPTPDFQPPATPEFFPPPLTPQSNVSKRSVSPTSLTSSLSHSPCPVSHPPLLTFSHHRLQNSNPLPLRSSFHLRRPSHPSMSCLLRRLSLPLVPLFLPPNLSLVAPIVLLTSTNLQPLPTSTFCRPPNARDCSSHAPSALSSPSSSVLFFSFENQQKC